MRVVFFRWQAIVANLFIPILRSKIVIKTTWYNKHQMDLYWMTKAGADPITYLEKYPGRFKTWYVKDMDEQGRFAPVGKGSIDFERILAQKELSGMQHYFVEQDMTFDGLDLLEAIKISKAGIEEIGFK